MVYSAIIRERKGVNEQAMDNVRGAGDAVWWSTICVGDAVSSRTAVLTTRLTPIVKVCVCVWFCTGRSTGALGDCLLQSVESWALTRTKRCKSFLFCFSGEAAAIVTGSDMR